MPVSVGRLWWQHEAAPKVIRSSSMPAMNSLHGSGLGLSAGEAIVVIQKLGPHLDTIGLVVNDPSFPTLMERIKQLNAMEASTGGGGGGGGSSTPDAAKVGVGLRYGVQVLDAAIYAKRNPWAVGLVGAGVLLFIGSIGFALGSRRKH
jgi:hypothetical protein